MATQAQVRGPVAVERPRHRFSVDDYHRMIEVGVLTPDDKVELIAGEVVGRMSAMNARHGGCIRQLQRRLERALGDSASISTQLPVAIPDYDEPEPDISVLRYREDEYAEMHPTAADVLIAIEVSDTSIHYDRRVKLPMYAHASIPESWLVDSTRRGDLIERHTDPDSDTGTYRTVVQVRRGEAITSTVLPDLSLPVDKVLGPRIAERGRGE